MHRRLYAHRGAAVELPENTLPAFERALSLGADAIETDAHLTKDGHIVLSHDATGERMCGRRVRIADATLTEVRSWNAAATFRGPSPGPGPFRIPTLEETIVALPDVELNVDAKSSHPEMAERIVDLVHRLGADRRVLLASFSGATLRAIRACGYRGRTGLAQSEVVRLLALPLSVLQLFPLQGFAAQIPYRQLGIDLGTRAVVEKIHALGLEAHYWTVNDPLLATRLLELGADAVMTDDPRAVAPAVRAFKDRSDLSGERARVASA